MDPEQRIEAVRQRLDTQYAVLTSAREAGPPCERCSHFIPIEDASKVGTRREGPYCGHLAYSNHQFSPATGVLSVSTQVPVEAARKADGLCGPEGTLFEPSYKFVVRRTRDIAGVGIVLAAAGALLMQILSAF